jgi:LPS sulfotransferase NodH
VRAVGFKLFYYHARVPPWSEIWQELREDPGVRVIHLTRRNILRTHLSRVLAARSDRWISTTAEPETAATVMLDETECLEAFNQTRAWEGEAREFFRDRPILEVEYEELVARQHEVMADVQAFLGLEAQELRAQTYPQLRQPMDQTILNFVELKQRFRGTPWESFFEDSSLQVKSARS